MRPIDADALIEKCGGWYVEEGTESGFIGTLENLLATEPTIQTVATDTNVGDTISRQAAIDAVNNAFDRETLLTGFVRSIAVRAIRDMPTVQPEPHEGHWIEGGIYRDVIECNCSECGQLMTTAATVRMNFCPNCGAKMKGERQK